MPADYIDDPYPWLRLLRDNDAGHAAVGEFVDYITERLAEVRRRGVDGPPNSVLEAVLAAEADGAAISPDEGVHKCLLVFNGGHETTTNLIAVGTYGLLRRLGEFARLAELDNSAVNVAIEEIIRYVSPLQLQSRRTTRDMDLPSGHLPAGTEAVLCQASANRDEQAFDEPDRLHLNRRPNAHVAFGLGVHSCLGNQLARLEARLVLPRLARRLPHLEFDGAPTPPHGRPAPRPTASSATPSRSNSPSRCLAAATTPPRGLPARWTRSATPTCTLHSPISPRRTIKNTSTTVSTSLSTASGPTPRDRD